MPATAKSHGFTLPELAITLAISGLVAAVALPGLGDLAAEGRRADAVNGLAGSLHLARSTALTRNVPVSLCPSADGRRCDGTGRWEAGWLVFVDVEGSGRPAPDSVLLAGDAQPHLAIRSARFGQGLGYRPNGQAVAPDGQAAGEFVICDAGLPVRVLAVGVAGKPQLRPPGDASPDACPRD